jgi:hypothetical protein
MGIRFLCATCGHKLNVKSFLAGKRGVCPKCGNGVDIPLESQITKQAKTAKPVAVTSAASGVPIVSPSPGDGPAGISASANHRDPLPTFEAPARAKKPLSRKAVSPSAGAPLDTAPADPGRLAVPMQPARDREALRPATPVATPVEVARPEPVPVDPIDEAPDAIWYIRPSSGGQYGPARGDIMRKWMGEGRVSADSLVWREGWDDWSTAVDVFPELGAGITPPVSAPASPASFTSPAAGAASAGTALRPRRRNSAIVAVTVVAVLGLMCIALFVALILILMN